MKIKNCWIDAVEKRVSRRTYINKIISNDDILTIVKLIDEINKESSLNIQFIKNGKDAFNGFKASYGLIGGANSFIALVGNKKLENYKQKIGYYGEMIVLEATNLNLGTCWVGGTYDKIQCQKYINFNENEELVCIIVIGHTSKEFSIKEKVVKSVSKSKVGFDDILISNNKNIDGWINEGIKSAFLAPSALNKKEIRYEIKNEKISAFIKEKNHGYEEVDLGISMLHFQLGAISKKYNGNWKFESGEHLFY